VKLLHDWVALNVRYDVPSLNDGSYTTKQRAERVLRDRTGVCAGYANLLVALGEVTGDEIVYVTGDTRAIDGPGHAWNAVRIDGAWTLMDATWDAGSVGDDGFEARYSTAYLFAPPSAFLLDHFPDDAGWQLREDPLTRGAFLRQHPIRPRFHQDGWTLLTDGRSPLPVGQTFQVNLTNTRGREILVKVDGSERECRTYVRNGMHTAHCVAERRGPQVVHLYDSAPDDEMYWGMGDLQVTASY